MKRKDLVDSVATQFNLKPGRARKIVDHILCEILEAGLSGDGFSSPIFRIASTDVAEKVVDSEEGQKVIPARRLMRLIKSEAYVKRSSNTSVN